MMLNAKVINAMILNAELLYNDCKRKKYILEYSSLNNTKNLIHDLRIRNFEQFCCDVDVGHSLFHQNLFRPRCCSVARGLNWFKLFVNVCLHFIN